MKKFLFIIMLLYITGCTLSGCVGAGYGCHGKGKIITRVR